MCAYDNKSQEIRANEIFSVIRKRFRPYLSDTAEAPNMLWWDQARMGIFGSNAFFNGNNEDIAFANTILRYVRDKLDTETDPKPFEATGMASLLMRHRNKLEPDVTDFLLDFLGRILPKGMAADFQFHGYNDNMPVMWSWALAAGAEIFDNSQYMECATANLKQLRSLFQRRGCVSEYGAGYATHRLTGIANIVELSSHEELKELALNLEARIWAELAGHWNTKFATFCGASMRGGPPFKPGFPSFMWKVFGDDVLNSFQKWEDYLEVDKSLPIELGFDPNEYRHVYPYCYFSEFCSVNYHVPDEIASTLVSKDKDFNFKCTSENGYWNNGIYCKKIDVKGTGGVGIGVQLTNEEVAIPHFPAHAAEAHLLNTYHGENYVLGTSTTNQFWTSNAFRCDYRKAENPRNFEDLGCVFVRYNLNDKQPCGRTLNTYWRSPDNVEEKENYCTLYLDSCQHHNLQEKNTVMSLQVPEALEYWQVKSMRTDLFFHTEYSELGDMYVNGVKIGKFPAEFDETSWITINEGAVYIAILPLICRNGARKKAMRVYDTEQYRIISLYNYEGDQIEMSERDMNKLGNGFIFEIRDASEYSSFEDFQAEMARGRVLDKLYSGVRRVHYARKDLRLSTHLCPYHNTLKYATVNGKNREFTQLSFSNELEKKLPFMDVDSVGIEDWDWIETQMNREIEPYNPVE